MPIQAGPDAHLYPAIAALLDPALRVLHWHGDTFDLPSQARHLAGSSAYPNQAFAIGNYGLALQFHLEVTPAGLERWYVGHACELAHANISVSQLREDSRVFASKLEAPAQRFWQEWLNETVASRETAADGRTSSGGRGSSGCGGDRLSRRRVRCRA